jgi:hypothetical protein
MRVINTRQRPPPGFRKRKGASISPRVSDSMPRFVLLEHHWNGVHWDLMLEAGDALRTWAIDAPIVPGVALPARALGDHRRLYLDYEGPVSGNRGWVRRVDSGVYEPQCWTADRVEAVFTGDQLVGRVELSRIGAGDPEPEPAPGGESARAWTFRLGNLD